jgi:hypothetical protein
MYAFRKKKDGNQYGALSWGDDEERSLMTVESFTDDDGRAKPMQSRKSKDQARRLEYNLYCRYATISVGVAVFLAVAMVVIFVRSDAVAKSIENYFS